MNEFAGSRKQSTGRRPTLESLPGEVLASIASHLDLHDIWNIRGVQNRHIIKQTETVFAIKQFQENRAWSRQWLCRESVECLERLANIPGFVPYITRLHFTVSFPEVLAEAIAFIGKTYDDLNESLDRDEGDDEVFLFEGDEQYVADEAHRQDHNLEDHNDAMDRINRQYRPESCAGLEAYLEEEKVFWHDKPIPQLTRLFQRLSALRELRVKTTWHYSKIFHEKGMTGSRRLFDQLRARFNIRREFPSEFHCFDRTILLIRTQVVMSAAHNAGLNLQCLGSVPTARRGTRDQDIFPSVLKLDMYLPYAWNDPDVAKTKTRNLNRALAAVPNVQDICIYGAYEEDHELFSDFGSIDWPQKLAALKFGTGVVLKKADLGCVKNLPLTVRSLTFEDMTLSRRPFGHDGREWFDALAAMLEGRELCLMFSMLFCSDQLLYIEPSHNTAREGRVLLEVPLDHADDIVDGDDERTPPRISTGNVTEGYRGADAAGYARATAKRVHI